MQKKWCLLKESDGARGDKGRKKIYEVIVDGPIVRMSWGMAEKTNRQQEIKNFFDEAYARQAAFLKVQEKINKGYELAYSV